MDLNANCSDLEALFSGTDRRSGRRIKRESLWKLQERALAWRIPLVCGKRTGSSTTCRVRRTSCPMHLRRFSDAWPHEVRWTKKGAKQDLANLMRMELTGRAPAPQTLSEPVRLFYYEKKHRHASHLTIHAAPVAGIDVGNSTSFLPRDGNDASKSSATALAARSKLWASCALATLW
jgi:hypothetical protein